MKLVEFSYTKPEEGPRKYNLLELDSSVSYVSGIALDKLEDEEKEDILTAYKNLEDVIEKYVKKAFRQFKKIQIEDAQKETLYHIYSDCDDADALFDCKGNLISTIDVYHGAYVDSILLERLGFKVVTLDFDELVTEEEKEEATFTYEIPNLKLVTKRLKAYIKEQNNDK